MHTSETVRPFPAGRSHRALLIVLCAALVGVFVVGVDAANAAPGAVRVVRVGPNDQLVLANEYVCEMSKSPFAKSPAIACYRGEGPIEEPGTWTGVRFRRIGDSYHLTPARPTPKSLRRLFAKPRRDVTANLLGVFTGSPYACRIVTGPGVVCYVSFNETDVIPESSGIYLDGERSFLFRFNSAGIPIESSFHEVDQNGGVS